MGDHYQTLGLGRDASKADIKNAFFRHAHRYHPDRHTHADAAARAEAARRFRQVKASYDVLYDERRRAEYDSLFRSSSGSSGYGNGHRGNSSSSSSSSANDHGHRRGTTSSASRRPPRPKVGTIIHNVIYCAIFGICMLGDIATELENRKRDQERMEQALENLKRELEKKEESREKEKKKKRWTDIFRS